MCCCAVPLNCFPSTPASLRRPRNTGEPFTVCQVQRSTDARLLEGGGGRERNETAIFSRLDLVNRILKKRDI